MWKKTKKTQQKTQKLQTKKPEFRTSPVVELTFIEHVYELRSRLFWVIATMLIMSSLAFVFKDALIDFILAPLHGEKLVYLTIGGGFSFIFTVCLYFGAVMAIPIVTYHLYRFLQPVLGETSRRLIMTLAFVSGLLAFAGAAFGYFVAIQASISFLMGFAEGYITSSVTAESYLNFIITYTAGLAIVFQLPLLLFMFDHIRPFPPGALLSSQRYVITGAIIIAALITPTPDVINQMIIAIPIIAIYQIGVIVVYIRHRSKKRAAKQLAKAANEDNAPAHALADIVATQTAPISQTMVVSNGLSQDKSMPMTVNNKEISAAHEAKKSVIPNRYKPIHRSIDGMKRPLAKKATVPAQSAVATSPSRSFRPASIDGFTTA